MEQLRNRRRGYYKGKYAKERQLVTGFLMAIGLFMAMNGFTGF